MPAIRDCVTTYLAEVTPNKAKTTQRHDHYYARILCAGLTDESGDELIVEPIADLDVASFGPPEHSLGAMCAPLIAKKGKDISGIIMLAGPARPFEDILLEQFTYLFNLESTIDADEKKSLSDLEVQIKKVKDPKQLKTAKASELPLGQPSYYWQSIKKYNQVQTAKGVKQPILVLQGKREYQVTMTDFEIWKKALENNPKNQFISYEGLNHLFIKGEGICTPAEYQVSGNVREQVIKDICAWIKAFQK